MLVIVGGLVVSICVFGGYLLEGGHIAVLFQPVELLIIGGAAMGSLLISSPVPLIKMIIHQVLGTLKPAFGTKNDYKQVLMLLHDLFKLAKSSGVVGLEPHVENPSGSTIFQKYPAILKNHHLMHFVCDTLKLQIGSSVSPYDLEDLMDQDIRSTHEEEHKGPSTVTRIGDAMPGLGIVAAVLGVVITMGKLSGGKEVIGHSVAAALVGTFLGILLSYGYLQPLAAKMELDLGMTGKLFEVVKLALLAFGKDCNPKLCVEFARRAIPPEHRPTFEEMENELKNSSKAA